MLIHWLPWRHCAFCSCITHSFSHRKLNRIESTRIESNRINLLRHFVPKQPMIIANILYAIKLTVIRERCIVFVSHSQRKTGEPVYETKTRCARAKNEYIANRYASWSTRKWQQSLSTDAVTIMNCFHKTINFSVAISARVCVCVASDIFQWRLKFSKLLPVRLLHSWSYC